MAFSSLGLSEILVQAVAEAGYAAPTPVQTAVIPLVLRGEDVRASAKTGSGKTASFVLPLLEILSAQRRQGPAEVRVVVLTPTRELAVQVGETIERFGRALTPPPKTCVATGGVSLNPQMLALRGGADFVIATPGRLLDLVAKNAVRLGSVGTLVLDEADRLLSLGFADELAKVLALLPARRQNLLFSATFPPAVRRLADALSTNPARVAIDEGAPPTPELITQRAIEVDEARRTALLRHLLTTEGWSRVLVFVASQHAALHVADKLTRVGVSATALHGDLSQGARTRALSDFKARRVHVLVATDLAARGLDIAALPAVVNYDLPRSTEDYVHRVGRTGRAGETGVAVSFVTATNAAHFQLIEKRHSLQLERERLPGFEPTDAPPRGLDPLGGVKGRRKSKKDKLREAAARAKGTVE